MLDTPVISHPLGSWIKFAGVIANLDFSTPKKTMVAYHFLTKTLVTISITGFICGFWYAVLPIGITWLIVISNGFSRITTKPIAKIAMNVAVTSVQIFWPRA